MAKVGKDKRKPSAFIPPAFEAGASVEFDWREAEVFMAKSPSDPAGARHNQD